MVAEAVAEPGNFDFWGQGGEKTNMIKKDIRAGNKRNKKYRYMVTHLCQGH